METIPCIYLIPKTLVCGLKVLLFFKILVFVQKKIQNNKLRCLYKIRFTSAWTLAGTNRDPQGPAVELSFTFLSTLQHDSEYNRSLNSDASRRRRRHCNVYWFAMTSSQNPVRLHSQYPLTSSASLHQY